MTISTKGVDRPSSIEALHIAGSPCFLHKEISFSFLHRFPQPLHAVFSLSKPVRTKGPNPDMVPISSPYLLLLGLSGRMLQLSPVCWKWWWPVQAWVCVSTPSPGTLSEQCFMGCCCVLSSCTTCLRRWALLGKRQCFILGELFSC